MGKWGPPKMGTPGPHIPGIMGTRVRTCLLGAENTPNASGDRTLRASWATYTVARLWAGIAGENLGPVTLHSATASERSLRPSAAWDLAQCQTLALAI